MALPDGVNVFTTYSKTMPGTGRPQPQLTRSERSLCRSKVVDEQAHRLTMIADSNNKLQSMEQYSQLTEDFLEHNGVDLAHPETTEISSGWLFSDDTFDPVVYMMPSLGKAALPCILGSIGDDSVGFFGNDGHPRIQPSLREVKVAFPWTRPCEAHSYCRAPISCLPSGIWRAYSCFLV